MRRIILNSVKVLVVGLLWASTPMIAVAQVPCSQWDLNGDWVFIQSNMLRWGQPSLQLRVTPDGIEGSARHQYSWEEEGFLRDYTVYRWRNGSVDGTINRDSIELYIFWENNTTGIYTGKINSLGRLVGSSYQRENPQNKAEWYSDRKANCVARVAGTGVATTKSASIPGESGVKSGGRVVLSGGGQQSSNLSKCQAAKIARERNSPAAPGLTSQCLALVNDLVGKGQAIAAQDDHAAALRSRQPDAVAQRGFDIGLVAAGGDTQNGPAKQAINDSLSPAEQFGFNAGLSYALERNRIKETQSNAALAEKGDAIANQDPLTLALRNLQPEGLTRRGFDIGMAAAERDTEPGPGKQRIHDSLLSAEQTGFTAAVTFLLARNKNAKIAAVGAAIAESDARVARVRSADGDPFYHLGFDIASGLFGDPAKGSVGSTQLGPGGLAIRGGLNAAGQKGFDASMKFHFNRTYR